VGFLLVLVVATTVMDLLMLDRRNRKHDLDHDRN
jgi:hypothetical protein